MISSLERSIQHAADEFGFEIARIGRGIAMRFATRAFLAVRVHQFPSYSIAASPLLGTMSATASSFLMIQPTTIATNQASSSLVTTSPNYRDVHAVPSLRNALTVPLWGGNQHGNLKTRVRSATSAAEQRTDNCHCNIQFDQGVLGAGVLSLPSGIAAIGDIPKAMIPACAKFFTLRTISAYTFHLIGRLVQVADSESSECSSKPKVTSLGQLWDKEIGISTFGLITVACFFGLLWNMFGFFNCFG